MPRSIHDETDFVASYVPQFNDPEDFVNTKIEMLQDDFCIKLTDEDIGYLRSFKTENEINAAVKGILNKYWK